MGAGFNALAQAGIEERLQKAEEERQAQLANIANADLSPEQQADAIRTLYARNPSALKRHIENLAGRLIGRKPQPVAPAYAPQTTTAPQAPPMEIGGMTLPAPRSVPVTYPGAKTQQERLSQDLSAGKSPQQQKLDLYKAMLDEQLGAQAQTLEGQVAAVRKIIADPSLSSDDKQYLVSLYGAHTERPTSDEMKRQDYQAALIGGYKGSYEQWIAEQAALGRGAGATKVGTFGGFLTDAYGPHPTPEQYVQARKLWAASGAGTTVGTHTIQVPQPDGSIKLYTVETSSSKDFGPLPTLPGAPASQPKGPAPRRRGGSASAGPQGGVTVGGKQTPEQMKATEQADQAETAYAQAQADLANPTPIGDTGLLIEWVRGHVAGAGRLTNTEVELTMKAGSWGTRLKNAMDRASTGTLDPAFRAQLVSDLGNAARIMRQQANRYGQPAPKAEGKQAASYKFTATNPQTGQKIGSNDQATWYDLKTGKRVQ